ncbi:MAG: hypothetical protein QXQ11_08515 [Candidatus Bathyarchaeia archaeon]
MKGPVKSRKGIATAIGAVFFILIVIVGFVAIWTINTYETRYQEVKTRMNEWDVQRISENLLIRSVENSAPPGYNLTITVDNNGGVPVNIARIYVYDQTDKTNLYIYSHQNGSSAGFVNGTINTGEVNHKILVRGTLLNGSHQYRIILATDRGRQFSYNYPPPTLAAQFPGQPVPFILTFEQESFQFKSRNFIQWTPAWVKKGQAASSHQIYRINLTNISGRNIVLNQSSHMRQEADDVSDVEVVWWICDPSTDPSNNKVTPFTSQTINAGEWKYVYFASSSEGGDSWQGDPTSTHYYTVVVHIFFNFEGEHVWYGQTIAIMGQKITP